MQDPAIAYAARINLLYDMDGCVTMTNPATGNHRTFRVRTQPQDSRFAPGQRVIGLLAGPDNTSDYESFGFVDGGRVRLWKKKNTPDFRKYADMLQQPKVYEEEAGIEYQYEARCIRCGRLLTHPDSISSRMGPECRKK